MVICNEGWPFIGGCAFLAALFYGGARVWQSPVLGILAGVCLVVAVFCAYFFRDPPRNVPQNDHVILSPADGKIMEIVEEKDPYSQDPLRVVRIFLSVFNAHLQRSPIRGRVHGVTYKTGKFLDARDPKAAFENEQNRIEIAAASERLKPGVVVTQIAGLIARRIVCDVKKDQDVAAGCRIGLIRFGSQVDLAIPRMARLRVKAGDMVSAGTTIIAEVP